MMTGHRRCHGWIAFDMASIFFEVEVLMRGWLSKALKASPLAGHFLPSRVTNLK